MDLPVQNSDIRRSCSGHPDGVPHLKGEVRDSGMDHAGKRRGTLDDNNRLVLFHGLLDFVGEHDIAFFVRPVQHQMGFRLRGCLSRGCLFVDR